MAFSLSQFLPSRHALGGFLILLAQALGVSAQAADFPTMVWFRTNHVRADFSQTTAGGRERTLYIDGEYRAATCGDTAPHLSAASLRLNGTALQAPAGALISPHSGVYTYSEAQAHRLWRLMVDTKTGTWWATLWEDGTDDADGDGDADESGKDDVLDVSLELDGSQGTEHLLLQTPVSHEAGETYYYRAGTAAMACFSVNQMDVIHGSNPADWWTGYLYVQGVYNFSDCRQHHGLLGVGARLRIDGTVLRIPTTGFRATGGGWFTYSVQTSSLTWWISVHPRSGVFWTYVWSDSAEFVSLMDGVDVTLQIGDQVGVESVSRVSPSQGRFGATYRYRAELGETCPRLR